MIAGIDLGTTNSLIGVMDAGFPILIAGSDGRRLTPSVVHYGPPGTPPLVGAEALRMAATAPARTLASIKRFIGRRSEDIPPADLENLPHPLLRPPGAFVRIPVDNLELAPEEISAEILKKLRRDAEAALGQPVTRAVITVPAYFNEAQRQATRRAGELAGLTVERILAEPTAAALAYGMDKLAGSSRIAVLDLGGGTFDLSILQLTDGAFQVIATAGDTRLGGDDLDTLLLEHLAAHLLRDHPDLADSHGRLRDPLLQRRLRSLSETVKIRLSDTETVLAELPFAHDLHLQLPVTRADLERLARPLLDRVAACCRRALADARITPADLDRVLLVGGATRMPAVRRLAAEIFQRDPDLSQHPDEAVALGAVLHAGVLDGSVLDVLLLDVTPLSLGIETFGGLMNVIIPRNTTIPAKAGELFTNAVNAQSGIRVRVLQGERELARDNWLLGEFDLPFPPAPKGQARIGVQFSLDADGLLHVLARDTATGHEKTLQIRSAVDVSDEAVEKMIADSLDHAWDDLNQRLLAETRLKSQELLPAVRRALALAGHLLPPHERENIENLASQTESALQTDETRRLKKLNSELDEATQSLAILLVEHAISSARHRKSVQPPPNPLAT